MGLDKTQLRVIMESGTAKMQEYARRVRTLAEPIDCGHAG